MIYLGLDFYGTIDQNPKVYKRLAENVLAGGGQVYIISAVKINNSDKLRKAVKTSKVPYSELCIVNFEDLAQIPRLKLTVCKEKYVTIMIDDMVKVTELLNANGVVALNALPMHYI